MRVSGLWVGVWLSLCVCERVGLGESEWSVGGCLVLACVCVCERVQV